jgi:hypothetical protein
MRRERYSLQGKPIDAVKVDVPKSDGCDVRENRLGRDTAASNATPLQDLV